MRAIRTKYMYPTQRVGKRIKAESGIHMKPFYVTFDDALSDDENHRRAAVGFAKQQGWSTEIVSGTLWIGKNLVAVHTIVPHTKVLVDKLEYELLTVANASRS